MDVGHLHCANWKIGKALATVDLHRKLCLPPWGTELDSDLDRWGVLELANGAPLGIIIVNVDSTEIHEAEAW